jgi:hypothetical protein
MKRPSLLNGIAFAFVIAVFSSPVWWGLKSVLPFFWTFRILVVVSYFAYIGYLLLSARTRIGALTLSAVNLAIALGLLSLPAGSSLVVSALAVMVTLNRSLLFHRSLLSIAFDGSISALGLTFAGYLFTSTGSMPAALWSYFLLQSVFAVIPRQFSERAGLFSPQAEDAVDPFLHSRRQAEVALQRLVQKSSD